jgi:ribonuclease P protein component
VLDEGERSQGERVVLFLAPGSGQVAFVAGRRLGGAVDRNRAKRIMRAAWRETRSTGSPFDVVLVARAGVRGARTQDLVGEMGRLMQEASAAWSG